MKRFLPTLAFVLSLLGGHALAETLTFTTYYYNDHLGNPVAATDERGDLLWRAHFTPYGERHENPADNAFGTVGYTGHAQDKASGLVYMGARYYDPVIGRFMAVDPVGFRPGNPQSFGRYLYANNNPYRYLDPDGRSPLAIEMVVVGAIVLTGAAIVNSNGWSTAFPASQGGGERYGGPSIDPTISGPWSTGRPASGFSWPSWMSNAQEDATTERKSRNKPPEALAEAEGRPHSIIEKPGKDGQYTTHFGDNTWKQYRGSGQDHGGIPRPNVKETGKNITPDGREFIDKGRVRPARPDETPGG